ncbi:MAG: polyribonucleotide nucleotidyltransferase [Planctomycetes bacterium GWC2_45_44]|nr:MAG: polyribonucleotide nucleotidyltransferase [Planctomycetes bacterium GWC2_45_44]HBR20764.1 polyribonucleotide nucleotidyltransferase [Phycisphaerales bacterium]
MSNVVKVEKQIGDKIISIETGKIAKQADAAVVVRSGDTMVLVAATSAPPRENIDYFPLSVDYREKLSAAGKFPGGFMKREGRPSTKEVLTARMIDRPLRPLFPDGYFNEVQVMVTVISADLENDPDILSMIGASAALAISTVPFQGPIGAVRLGRVDGQFVINPTHDQREKSDYNLILAGRRDAINMIEVDAKQVSEDIVAAGIELAHQSIVQICDLIDELTAKCGKQKQAYEIVWNQQVADEITAKYADEYAKAFQIVSKADRNAAVKAITDKLAEIYCVPAEGAKEASCSKIIMGRIVDAVQTKIVRKLAIQGKRLDGRGFEQVRPISCEVGLLPRSHGSSLFTRGETQALISVTLGTGQDEQIVDGLLEEYGQKFMLHYNFPPFSVGEVRPIRGPGRREIGHGALAEKALEQVMPDADKFSYTVKIVSEITESNGSSSMASVCGGTLAMMDAGIPVLNPVAGISIGMVSEEGKRVLLTDIIGDEDHFGDMDFKVAGTKQGITAIQLDIKATSLPHDIIVETLEKARVARLQILETMAGAISESRPELSVYAPKLISIKIDPELIGKVIGPGGKMIKSIQAKTGATIEIEDDGTICISCVNGTGHEEAKKMIQDMTEPPTVGKIYENARVVSIKEFGAFVEILPGVEGLCHISEIDDGYVKNVENVCKIGDLISVKLLLIDDQGRLKLSRKAALIQKKAEEKSGK